MIRAESTASVASSIRFNRRVRAVSELGGHLWRLDEQSRNQAPGRLMAPRRNIPGDYRADKQDIRARRAAWPTWAAMLWSGLAIVTSTCSSRFWHERHHLVERITTQSWSERSSRFHCAPCVDSHDYPTYKCWVRDSSSIKNPNGHPTCIGERSHQSILVTIPWRSTEA